MAAFLSALLRIPPGSVVHHILQAPPFLHRLLGHKLLLSWVGTTFPKPASQLSDWVVSSFSARSADRIDVLNPDIFAFLRRSPRLSPKLSLTAGGTFVDFNHFRPAKSKRNDVVFLGSLVRRRGIVRFVAALPTIAERLAQSGLVARFVILGKRGDAADEVDRLLAGDDYRKLDIHVGKTSNPAAALSEAKVFVALQAVSNYPSKALAEAMACGCVPVITDVGESRLMADDTSAVFIGGDYVPDDLANAISGLLTLNREEFTRRSERVRKAALHRFSIDVQSDYFASLYEGMIGQSGGLRS